MTTAWLWVAYFTFLTFYSFAKLVITVFILLFLILPLKKTFSGPSFEVTSSSGIELETKIEVEMFAFSFIQHYVRHCGHKDELDIISTSEDFQMYKGKSLLNIYLWQCYEAIISRNMQCDS